MKLCNTILNNIRHITILTGGIFNMGIFCIGMCRSCKNILFVKEIKELFSTGKLGSVSCLNNCFLCAVNKLVLVTAMYMNVNKSGRDIISFCIIFFIIIILPHISPMSIKKKRAASPCVAP